MPSVRRRYLGCRVVKSPIAYPSSCREHEAARADLAAHGTGSSRPVQRGSQRCSLTTSLMEDIYWRTCGAIGDWADGDLSARPEARRPPHRPDWPVRPAGAGRDAAEG